jgi:type II secretory pathway predicted ATPase ExeA
MKGDHEMYLKHFGLNHQPFAEQTPVERLFNDTRMSEGLARLRYLAVNGTFGLVTGATGLGKSVLVKRLIHELREPGYETCYLYFTQLPALGLLQQLVRRLGGTPKWHKEELFCQLLDRARQAEETLLIVLDEAHLLPGESLVDLRLLISSALEDAPTLKLLLVGQESLLETLRRAAHRDLLDRATVRYPLYPFSKADSVAYIDFQVLMADGPEKLFPAEVKELIHDHTGGVPRAINNLATASLLAAAAAGVDHVDSNSFQRTLSEFHLP